MSCSCCQRDIVLAARGLCRACYSRFRKTGTTEYQRKGKVNYCQIKDCADRVVSHGLCDKHRKRLERHQNTENTRPEYWGAKEKHPMYGRWGWLRRHECNTPVDKEWLDDFFQFVMDVGAPPSRAHKLYRADDSRPIGPDNFVWKESVTQKVSGEDHKTYQARFHKVYRALRPEAHRNYDLKRHFGLSVKDIDEMMEHQNGLCAICNQPESSVIRGKTVSLAVDHCHATGKIRGLLCTKCNRALGLLNDSVGLLKKAIAYLESH